MTMLTGTLGWRRSTPCSWSEVRFGRADGLRPRRASAAHVRICLPRPCASAARGIRPLGLGRATPKASALQRFKLKLKLRRARIPPWSFS